MTVSKSLKFFAACLFLGSLDLQAQNTLASNEFEADNVSAVTLRGKFCDIHLERGDNVYFKGVIEGKGNRGDYEITSDLKGDHLYIEVDGDNRNWRWNRITKSRLMLKIPSNTKVFVENSSGDIMASGLDGEDIQIHSTSGDVNVRGLSGKIELGSTSGDLEVEDIQGEISLESTSGDIEVEEISGSVSIRSTSGDIDINKFEGELKAKSTSGELTVDDGKGKISLGTTSGSIEGRYIEITDDINLKASSGEISIEFVNDLEALNFDLQSSSGDLDVGNRSGEKNMYIKRGDGFWVNSVTSSGDMDFSN